MEVKKQGISEDWLSLWLGLVIFVISLFTFAGNDLMGWGVKTSVWTDISKSTAPVSKMYTTVKGEITKIDGNKVTLKKADGKDETITVQDASALKVGDSYVKQGISGLTSLIVTYLFMLVLMGIGAKLLGANVGKFALGFTVIFALAFICWTLGHYAYIAATKDQLAKFNIPWSMNLTGEAGYIVALIAGLAIGNFFPKTAANLKEATRPELYIKTAIVIMGAALGVKAAGALMLASAVMFRGLCAIIEAYLIYWAVVYYVARRYFKFSREWSAPLASGISICGVSAAIATGGAIRARPVVPIMVSSLVVVFSVVELIVLPFFAQIFLSSEPLVAGGWMGLAVKTDGAAVASGAVADSLIRAKALAVEGVKYEEGWITMTTTTVKIFIDIFIGIWAFVLALVWCAKIECKPGQKVRGAEIWHRFPKFVLGYAATFLVFLFICLGPSKIVEPFKAEIKGVKKEIASVEKQLASETSVVQQAALNERLKASKDKIKAIETQMAVPKKTLDNANLATTESNVFRQLFFVLTFFAIGIVSNFKKLWEEGIGKLAAVYLLCLFGFIIWVGLFISWLFFHGMKPPVL
ncbi:MAG: YeiH family protein [Nitrospiraceae bacterium]|nr:YeiH family protein [Nitrospiraceae bacterium]